MGAIYRNGQKFTTSPNNAEMINYKNTTVASELDSLNSTMGNLSSNITNISSSTKIKLASNASEALKNAKEYLIIVGTGKQDSNYIGLSIYVPILVLSSTPTYFEVSDSYNGGTHAHLQACLTSTSMVNYGIYYGASAMQDGLIRIYYR